LEHRPRRDLPGMLRFRKGSHRSRVGTISAG
jgi:hypothetical protein